MPVTDPGEVWQFEEGNGGAFAAINRPTAAVRAERDLPQGDHPFQLYSLATPNGQKVTILFEELLATGHEGAEYDAWRIDISNSDQFGSGFTALNPNQKIPALLDNRDPARPVRLFESGSILVHLAEAFGAFLPADGPARAETLNWLFWQMGAAPILGGGFGHFFAYAPERFAYPLNRYAMEVKRQLDVLDRALESREFINGENYSIADIALWPWYGGLALGTSYKGADTFLATREYSNLVRWAESIAARPAVRRGKLVNSPDLHDRHSAADIDAALAKDGG
ncbi:glutathione-dependent disulfide-bond oxidoreductase [Sphingomonas sp. ASV193]|uniref:glutathione-dependent disulfide-bond oxidoreductase n=1 Tax=Sphingomonas sp. ASV193 TaxID=3144405 RepID=UPI0032E88BBF